MYILIIEDHDSLAANIGEYLEQQGDVPDFAAQGETALALCHKHDYDAIVLDLNLPGIDGIDVCTHLRRDIRPGTPILILTARDTVADRITGLEAGADDYLTKPFSLRELYLRLHAIMRRRTDNPSCLRVGALCMHPQQRLVYRADEPLALTPINFSILELLMQAFPGVVTRRRIEHAIWRDQPPDSEAALRGHILRLRRLLATADMPEPIKTVHGVGYRLCAHD